MSRNPLPLALCVAAAVAFALPAAADLPDPCLLVDTDGDAAPDCVEEKEGTDPAVKDNDVFASSRLFVLQQYRDFVFREGDEEGVASWQRQLDGGTLTRAQVIEQFVASGEFQAIFAELAELYWAFFRRFPDQGGLDFWAQQLRAGADLREVAGFFAGSAEFAAAYGSLGDPEFVFLVYQNLLERPPDLPGFLYWLGRLESGEIDRGGMVVEFADALEFEDRIADALYVTQVYVGMLRRVPDPEGFLHWLGELEAGAPRIALIEALLASDEYHDRFLP